MNIIQIGANIGNDDLTPIVKEYKDQITNLILVEPMSVHNIKLGQCYMEIPHIIENIAITDNKKEKELSFYYHVDDIYSTGIDDITANDFAVASFDKNHILKHNSYNVEGLREKKVKCLTLNELFDKYNLINIDILFIDAEGMDDKLIKSINFDKYNITNIIYENLHIDNISLVSFLHIKKYDIQVGWGQNQWSNLAVKR